MTNYIAAASEPMKIAILGGFLGSGKTTVLIQLLSYLAGDSDAAEIKTGQIKVAVIENEIGEIGVDNAVISGAGYHVKTLMAGCVCCTMAGDLVRSIERIQKELVPEWIVVESSGVAYPKAMKALIQTTFGIVPRITIVIDAKRWQRLLVAMQNLITGQLEAADTILINKTDLVSVEELKTIQTSVAACNDSATQLSISATMPIAAAVWDQVIGL